MAHDRDAVGLGGGHFLELLDHLLGIPVREDVVHLGAEVGLSLLGAVVHVVGEHAALRAAGEEDDAKVGAPVGRISRGGLRGGGAAGAAGAAAGTQDVNVATRVTRINRTKMLRFIIPSLGCHVVGWTIRLWDAWGYSAGWCTSFSTRLDTELSRTRNCGWILTVSRPSPNSWPAWIKHTIWRTAVRPISCRILLDGCQRRREAGRLGDP